MPRAPTHLEVIVLHQLGMSEKTMARLLTPGRAAPSVRETLAGLLKCGLVEVVNPDAERNEWLYVLTAQGKKFEQDLLDAGK